MEPTALYFLILTVGGWMNRRQADAIEYLLEENRVQPPSSGSAELWRRQFP